LYYRFILELLDGIRIVVAQVMVPTLGSILFLDVFSGSGTVALGSSEKHFMEDYVASENFTKFSKKIGNLFKSCCCVRASDWKTYKDQGPTANFQIYMDDILYI